MAGKRAHQQRPETGPPQVPPAVKVLLGAEAHRLALALLEPPPVSIRWNLAKRHPGPGEAIPWCAAGRYLAERPLFTLDPLLHAGAYYVQEASSMLLESAFRACSGLPPDPVVLDLCAAPGGKSTHLAALIPDQALLIANDPVATRRAVLAENLWKWGRPNVMVTGGLPGEFTALGPFCDLVLVDAPCSGEGMFRKDPFAWAQWSNTLVEQCAERQGPILGAAWHVLKPGGWLIYCTCTWEVAENEDQVRRLMEWGAEHHPIPMDEGWGMVDTGFGTRCYPHRVRGEGFFMALLRKPAGTGRPEIGSSAVARTLPPPPAALGEWLNGTDGMAFMEMKGMLHALAAGHRHLAEKMMYLFPLEAPGIPVARRKGAAWAPHPALALSSLVQKNAFRNLDLDHADALRFLRGEALPASGAAGTALVGHAGLPIGWATGAGNRWNNHWPAPWRIRMR